MLDDVADEILRALRFGALDSLPDGSRVVRSAEAEALKVFDRRMQMEKNILAARSPPLEAKTNTQSALNGLKSTSECPLDSAAI
jgi:sigma54-dependent transcription regulator